MKKNGEAAMHPVRLAAFSTRGSGCLHIGAPSSDHHRIQPPMADCDHNCCIVGQARQVVSQLRPSSRDELLPPPPGILSEMSCCTHPPRIQQHISLAPRRLALWRHML